MSYVGWHIASINVHKVRSGYNPILELLDGSYPIHVRNDVKCSILDIYIFI
jgi:hypothetical protein